MADLAVDAQVNQLAQALHAAECSGLTRVHSWTTHQRTAALVCAATGFGNQGRQVSAAFKEGFDSSNRQVADFVTEIEALKTELATTKARLTSMRVDRDRVAAARTNLRTELAAELERGHGLAATAEADRRALIDERTTRIQAENRARDTAREHGDTARALAAARQEIAALKASRLHVAEALQNEYTTPTGRNA